MADLCGLGKPVLFHVSKAENRQADAFRCDPAGGGRISPAVSRLSDAGRGCTGEQSGLAYPSGQAACIENGGAILDAAEPSIGVGGAGCQRADTDARFSSI